MQQKIFLFIKSFVITSCCALMISALVSGLIVADRRISQTTGNPEPQPVEFSSQTNIISLNLFGATYSADLTPVKQAAEYSARFKPLILPEIRLIYEAVDKLTNLITEALS